MEKYLMQQESLVRMAFFFGMLLLVGIWEVISPRRKLTIPKLKRWANNLGIVFFNSFAWKTVFTVTGAGVAAMAAEKGWGVFNNLQMPYIASLVASIVLMDMVIYFQHVMVHSVPLFWRLHQVHHADMDYDVTTGARFHTLEIILSMFIKFAAIVLIGAPVVAVVLFEIILNATAMFNHGNIHISGSIDRYLRMFIVTPDMHRVHHSTIASEANSNFGFNLPWWDRIFGTYKDQPLGGHVNMEIGIHSPRDERHCVWISGMLAMPFLGKITDYAINQAHAQKENK